MIKASMSSGKVTLFHQDPRSRVTYRVPALLYIPTDTLLAFAEKRSSARDEDAEYLVLRRGRKTGTLVKPVCVWLDPVGRKSRAKQLKQKPAQPSGELLQPRPCSLRGRQNQEPKVRLFDPHFGTCLVFRSAEGPTAPPGGGVKCELHGPSSSEAAVRDGHCNEEWALLAYPSDLPVLDPSLLLQWEPSEPLRRAVLPGHRTMSPCPVYERKSQTVFLFFICVRKHVTEQWQIWTGQNAARLCYVRSKDAGQTWSSLTDLTEQVIGEDLKDWATFSVGPGHGVQLSSGRLVIPAYTYHITARCCRLPLPCWTLSRSLVFYSDNGGRHWHKGELIKGMKTGECQVAEVVCQACRPVLYCNARTPCQSRATAFSTDQGLTFESPSSCEQLCEPPHGCQGSVVSFTPTTGLLEADGVEEPDAPAYETTCLLNDENAPSTIRRSTMSWLLYSHPMDKRKRVDLGIYLNQSPLNEAKWEHPWLLYKGPCSYSDLAVLQEAPAPLLFGCLFECGVNYACEEIAFQLFCFEDLQKDRVSRRSLEKQPKPKLKCN